MWYTDAEVFVVNYFLYYILAVSALSAFVTWMDKLAAKKHMWRIPEKCLFLLSALGGSASMYITMRLIHHKTKHKRFMIGIPCILLAQIAAIGLYLYFRT